MPTNTYVALDKVTVSGSSTTSITFSSIPSTYTDLVIVANGSESADQYMALRLNGDTGSNYSDTYVQGSGSAATSSRTTSQTYGRFGSGTVTGQWASIIQIQNYSNATTYKTWLWRSNLDYVTAGVSLWRSTAAVTSVTLFTNSAAYFTAGSTFSLYGIKSEEAAAKATGGMVTSDATYWYHTFTSTGTFTPKQSLTCDYLVVAGGGGGASRWGGGGGAGGFRTGTGLSVTATGYSVTVGSGGAGGASAAYNPGSKGSNSVFSTISSTGGGGGRQSAYNGVGGSGGGGSTYNQSGGTGNEGGYSPVEGYAGGTTPALQYQGAGGGGAGAVGSDAPSNQRGGAGGIGSNSVSTWATATGTGASGYYAGGGGGGGETANSGISGGLGGLGGGGRGGNQNESSGVAGTANTGGGGGGGANDVSAGAAGGSGIVIIRYPKV